MVSMPTPTVLVNGQAADPDHVALPVTILHGRSSPTSQADAPQLSVTWSEPATVPKIGDTLAWVWNTPADPNPPTWADPRTRWADPHTTWAGAWVTQETRFVGRVTDVDTEEVFPGPAASVVVAVGWQADLGRVHVLLDQPPETDIQRVHGIAAAAGVSVTVLGDPSPMLAADAIDTDALSALYQVCESTGGLFWQAADGTFMYGTGNHRQLGEPVAVLPAHSVVDGVRWQTGDSSIINRITVTWGPEDNQQQHTLTDDDSVATYGRHDVTVSTLLVDQPGADQLANLILARRAWPSWNLTDVMVDSLTADDPAVMVAARQLAVSDAVLIPIPPTPGPVGTPAEWVIEGWAEVWTEPDRVILQYAVTDRLRYALTTLRLWSHAAQRTWADELARGTWLDTLILQPGESMVTT